MNSLENFTSNIVVNPPYMSGGTILNKSKEEIASMLQFIEYECDEYIELIHTKIIPSLDISTDDLKGLSADMYHTVICKKINEIMTENEALRKKIYENGLV